jgi:hypothetical protein
MGRDGTGREGKERRTGEEGRKEERKDGKEGRKGREEREERRERNVLAQGHVAVGVPLVHNVALSHADGDVFDILDADRKTPVVAEPAVDEWCGEIVRGEMPWWWWWWCCC